MNITKLAQFAIGPIVSAAVSFITLPIITWIYSTEDIGRIAMLQVVTSLCILVFSLGLDQAYVREYHEAHQKSALFKAALSPGLLLLTIALSITLLFPGIVSKILFSIESIEISWLVAACLLASFSSRFLSLILRMKERGLAFSTSQILPKILFLILISSYTLLKFGVDFLYLVSAHTISILSVTLVLAWNTRNEWLTTFREPIDHIQLKSMLYFGMPLIVGGFAYWGLTSMDRLFLRSMSTFEQLGIYSVASSFAGAAIIFQSVFSTVWAPTVYKWTAEGINNDKIDKVTDYVLAAIVFIFILTGIFSWIVTFLLPEKYHQVQYILVACMAYPLFYTLSETTAVGLGVNRKSGYAMMAAIISALANMCGNYFLVPSHGAIGAAISTACSFWIFFFCRTEFSCLVWRKIPRVKIYGITLLCLISAITTAIFSHDNPKLYIFIWGTMGVVYIIYFKENILHLHVKIKKLI